MTTVELHTFRSRSPTGIFSCASSPKPITSKYIPIYICGFFFKKSRLRRGVKTKCRHASSLMGIEETIRRYESPNPVCVPRLTKALFLLAKGAD